MSRPDAVNSNRQALLREAADWLVRLDAGELNQSEQQALLHWHQTSPEHERVWKAACELNRNFSCVPTNLARPVLNRQRLSRRAALKSLAGVGLLLPLSWTMVRSKPWQPWLADHRSATGERRSLVLGDGSELTLNTDTALDLMFDDNQHLVRLYEGEVFLRTKKDLQQSFTVMTAEGSIQAQASEFAVRCLPNTTRVTVTHHAVLVSPRLASVPQRVDEGQQCLFTPKAIKSLDNADPDSLAWRRGELIVDNWRLDAFVQELGRYHPGILRCAKDVASLRVSGVFQTNNIDQALEVLEQVFNLKINRFTDYWVSIGKMTA